MGVKLVLTDRFDIGDSARDRANKLNRMITAVESAMTNLGVDKINGHTTPMPDRTGTNRDHDLRYVTWLAFKLDSDKFSGTEWTDLTDGGQTTLHGHPVSIVQLTFAAHDLSTTPYGGPVVLVECDATDGAFTVTLPAVASAHEYLFIFKKVDSSANAVTLETQTDEVIA